MIIVLFIIIFLIGWYFGTNTAYMDCKKEINLMRQKVNRVSSEYEDEMISKVLNFSRPLIYEEEAYIKIKDVAGIIKGK